MATFFSEQGHPITWLKAPIKQRLPHPAVLAVFEMLKACVIFGLLGGIKNPKDF